MSSNVFWFSIADGIALAAAANTASTDVEIIVFFAIILHKAPAAFAFVSFLLHEGFDRAKIRKHLLIFSLSAPASSLVTYFGIAVFNKDSFYEFNTTGKYFAVCLSRTFMLISLFI